jgi:hypothetical protein
MRIMGVMAKVAIPERFGDLCHAHWHARVA